MPSTPSWKGLLKAGAIVGGIPAAVLLVAALALLARPDLLLNTATFSRALRHFGRDYAPAWRELSLDVSSPGLFDKDIALRAADFCFKARSGSLEGCVKSLDALVSVRIGADGIHLARVSRFLLKGESLRIDADKFPRAAKARDVAPPFLLPAFLQGLDIGAVSVSLPSTEVLSGGAALRGDFATDYKPDARRPFLLRAAFVHASQGRSRHYSATAALTSDLMAKGGLSFVDADALLSGDDGTSASLRARASRAGPREIKFTFTAAARRGPRRLAASGRGSKTPEALAVTAALNVDDSSGPLKSLSLSPLVFSAEFAPGSNVPRDLELTARFTAEPGAAAAAKSRGLARTVRGRLSAKARATPQLGSPDHFDASASIAFEPVKEWFELGGKLEATVSGRTSRLADAAIAQKSELEVKVARFKDLVASLAGTRYAVPAPLADLDGPLSLRIQRSGSDARLQAQEARYGLDCALRGQRQRLKIAVAGKLSVLRLADPARSFQNTATVTLEDVALQMPPLSVKSLPSIARDPRIRHGGPPPPPAAAVAAAPVLLGALTSEVRIVTAKPALLYSNLAKTPVPISLDLTADFPPPTAAGTVAVSAFSVQFFRREALIDHLRFDMAPGSKLVAVDGLAVYKTPDAVVDIRLTGTTAKPQVQLDSVPPYSRPEIIALLLFGKSPGELDTDQQTTVANTQSALSENAFGLASLYLFASTPIEFVGYDSASRGYTMKFRLPGGASLAVGSNATQAENLTLRKRLAAHWAVQTEAGGNELQSDVVTTMLEWFNRY